MGTGLKVAGTGWGWEKNPRGGRDLKEIEWMRGSKNESSKVCAIIKPGRRVKLNRSQAVNIYKLLTIRYVHAGRVRIEVVTSRGWCQMLTPRHLLKIARP